MPIMLRWLLIKPCLLFALQVLILSLQVRLSSGSLYMRVVAAVKIKLLLSVMGAEPQLRLLKQLVGFYFRFRYTKLLHFSELATRFAHHHDADGA